MAGIGRAGRPCSTFGPGRLGFATVTITEAHRRLWNSPSMNEAAAADSIASSMLVVAPDNRIMGAEECDMSERDLVEVYRAKNNLQASLLAQTLNEIGIQALVQEGADRSGATESLGTVFWSDAPRIMVSTDQAEFARQLLLGWEEQKRQEEARAADGSPIDLMCEACGKITSFPASQRGSVQNCTHCHAYVDVGEIEFTEGDFDSEP